MPDRFIAASFSWYDLLAQSIPARYLALVGWGVLGLITVLLCAAVYYYFSRGD